VATCYLRGSRQVTLNGIGHLGLLTEPEVMGLVAEALTPKPLSP